MQREAIFVAVDRDGAQAELGGGPEAANGDFRTVGDEQFPHRAVNARSYTDPSRRPP